VFISEALALDALFAENLSSERQVAASVFILLYQQLGQYLDFLYWPTWSHAGFWHVKNALRFGACSQKWLQAWAVY